MIIQKYALFGSEVEFCLDTEKVVAEPLMDDAYKLGLRLQKIFNLYDESSELSLLNKGRSINASDELLEVIRLGRRLSELSDGEYDISLGKKFLNRKRHEQLPAVSCSYKDIQISGNEIKLLHEDVLIDLGSVAKGYIAERLTEFFMDQGIESGYVDARGDIRIFGGYTDVGVKHPRAEGLFLKIRLNDSGVATSGDYKQYHDDYSKSHIINQKDIISATVVSDDLSNADAYATILMVCSKDVREKIINESKYPAMVIDKNLKVHYFNGFEELINEN